MALLIGTDDGLYRAADVPFDKSSLERILDCGRVTQVEDFEHAEGVFASTSAGAYRSRDGGDTWTRLDVPKGDRYWFEGESTVFCLHAAPDGALYAGTNLPALYRSFDDGESWHELRGFQDLRSRSHWESPEDPKRARIRNVASPPNVLDRLVVAVEVGGVHVSDDGGETWTDLRGNLPEDDVHQVLPLTADCWLAATGYFDLELEHVGLQSGTRPGGAGSTERRTRGRRGAASTTETTTPTSVGRSRTTAPCSSAARSARRPPGRRTNTRPRSSSRRISGARSSASTTPAIPTR